jgi:hypothetical protein
VKHEEADFINNRLINMMRSHRASFNYAAGVGASYQPDDKNNLKINFGKTFRVPVPSELTANGMHHGTFRYEVGDDTIEPEKKTHLTTPFSRLMFSQVLSGHSPLLHFEKRGCLICIYSCKGDLCAGN